MSPYILNMGEKTPSCAHLISSSSFLLFSAKPPISECTSTIGLLDELHGDAQTTLAELRELAYGIYPPLLRQGGLAEALRTVANRSATPVTVEAGGRGRYDPDVESAV